MVNATIEGSKFKKLDKSKEIEKEKKEAEKEKKEAEDEEKEEN